MSKNKVEMIVIVDKNDKIIGYKDRNHLAKDDIYRVSGLWIINSRGEILLAKRHRNKLHSPGKWQPGVAGTVNQGETYGKNIIKEAKEELGLKNIKPTIGPKTKTEINHHHFTQWYTLKIDKPLNEFKVQKDETEKIKWFSPKELKKELKEHPEKFTPNLIDRLKIFLKLLKK